VSGKQAIDLGRYDGLKDLETPCYVFSPEAVIADYKRLREALGTPLIVSLKANPNVDLYVRCAHVFTDGVELASIGELNLAVARAAVTKFISTPALDSTLISAALASRQTIIMLDNLAQVHLLLTHGKASSQKVGLRLNARALLGNAMSVAHSDHFGMCTDDALIAIKLLRKAEVAVAGVHVFAGSRSFSKYGLAICERAHGVIEQLEAALDAPLDFINLGGGFEEQWNQAEMAVYRERVGELQKRLTVFHEAGRAIFQRGGTFLAKVISVKSVNDRTFVVCDGGIAQAFLLAKTEAILKRRKDAWVVPQDSMRETFKGVLEVVGNSCSQSDVIGEIRDSIIPVPGDIVQINDCGAYHTYSPTGFLNLRAPSKYIVS
jgi:diaminopimelate decarboxylase